MRRVVWNCLPVLYKLYPCCSLTAHNTLDFLGDLRSANKAAIMGVVLHYSIFFMLYMHSLRICFGCLDGKFFSFRLVVSIIFGSLFSKLSDKIVRNTFISWKKIKKKLIRPTLKIGNKSSCKIFCSKLLPIKMTFLRLMVNFFSCVVYPVPEFCYFVKL